ncbi:MAG: hypothetical protein SGJ11_13225 [Phycisphaerae bacterium]|nr:hypothetical protein [Phycisphaerae bacterium]
MDGHAARDEIARHAARLLRDGKAENVRDAIRLAQASAQRRAGGTLATEVIQPGLVREHVRGLALEALGDAGYRAHVDAVLAQAEEVMTLLVTQLGEPNAVLVGRTARAQVDGDPCCRIRVETDESPGTIAAVLVAAGYEEPVFGTTESRYGRLARLSFVDEGVAFRIVRCPPGMRIALTRDLKSDKPVPALTLDAIRRMLAADDG